MTSIRFTVAHCRHCQQLRNAGDDRVGHRVPDLPAGDIEGVSDLRNELEVTQGGQLHAEGGARAVVEVDLRLNTMQVLSTDNVSRT